jgi:hypothetical protein
LQSRSPWRSRPLRVLRRSASGLFGVEVIVVVLLIVGAGSLAAALT